MNIIKFSIGLLVAGLMIPTIVHAEIGKRPNTPLVAVKEIDPNWVTISALGESIDDSGLGYWNVENHPAQANALATFVCQLYNRTAVSLSLFGGPITHGIFDGEPLKSPYLIMKNSYYLFACAVE